MARQRVLLFGDQTVEKLASIRNLIEMSRRSSVLRKFLLEAVDILQKEIHHLNLKIDDRLSSLDELLSLAERNEQSGLSFSLITVERVGELILYLCFHPNLG